MKILLAEDDVRLGKLISHMLEKEFYLVDWVRNGKDAYDQSVFVGYDVIILDWMLPKEDGLSVCKRLREKRICSGILFVTAKDANENIVSGLDAGADDYIVKPFEFNELLARIRAISRRKEKPLEEVVALHDYTLNLHTHEFKRQNFIIELTRKEYQLLELLMRNQNQIMTREVLFEKLWGYDGEVSDNALDALVKLVRKKIDVPGSPSLIQNVRGIGYKVRTMYV
ncbi:response regulator transcription factor [Neobacillus niacini]|uniref:response regulator transcription factor n=1 Tax=Neobacillus niacini TaxID=86668 RepID=UPI0028570B1B|nr:response regulator transcription factor [Neobacillus niacini]MDR6998474.1 DNA-binding response OmpR family regulator [Neobacillus niacini]